MENYIDILRATLQLQMTRMYLFVFMFSVKAGGSDQIDTGLHVGDHNA